MEKLNLNNLYTALAIVIAALLILVFLLRLIALWYVKKHRPAYLDLVSDKRQNPEIIKAFKKSGLREFHVNTNELGFVSSWGKNRKDAISKVIAKGLTIKNSKDAK
ncbi:hypothetical protein ACFSYG_11985 [Leeuwenhoekiella polynyae]|uniref:Uncharacterized protein n=1 Tax=Leeuwenhoekiella polynyae TaxID=1550906 RepID=A0A4Q0PFL0_9FLAO|nr:hypothetical protein [Leeuwenhoekiella polynyae]RXG25685.1 hypothetical protein DSM02_852 [Leeuwenhoekiella polynyae]